MTDQFIFFCTNIGNEMLLKEEIRIFYPELTLSYSKKGFVTFKNKGVLYSLTTIAQLEVTFATRAGICLGKATQQNLIEKVSASCNELDVKLNDSIIHSFSINTDFVLPCEDIFARAVNQYSANEKTVIDIMTLGENEIWYGIHTVMKGTTRYSNASLNIEIPKVSPSGAFLKLAQTVELFGIKFNKNDLWLDFGSAPGGSSLYLLEKGCKVWGVDTAKMSELILSNRNYNHISTAVQDLSQEKLPDEEITWIHVDLNLNPKQTIKEVLRLAKKFNFSLKGIICTIPVIKMDHVKNIENYEDHFFDWGFTDIVSRQVPSHKQEYILIAKRDKS